MQRKESFEELRERMLKSAKSGIKSAYSSEEYALIQSINAYLETEKSMNLAYERLTEWFGIYLPEIRMSNARTLAALALSIATKPITLESVAEAVEDRQKAEQIVQKANQTIGRKMNDEEKQTVASFAKMLKDMGQSMESLQSYIKASATRVLPNVTYLTDEKIAAEMLSKAGSMERFALMPASTVQLLGAEKALFKHLKFGNKPPKYGVLFKFAPIGTAPKDKRGKIARVYATKIAIALKADYYSKNFIAKDLKESIDSTVQRILKEPEKQKQQQHRNPAQQQGRQLYRSNRPRQGNHGHHGNERSRFKRRDGGRDSGKRGF